VLVAGVDGIKNGWVAVTWDGQASECMTSDNFRALLERLGDADAIGVDMPIGLPDAAETGGRHCEREARKILRRRASSVFNSPSRAALSFHEHGAASAANRATSNDQLGLSRQSFALFDKLREVDGVIDRAAQDRIFEVHPEVSFSLMADQLGEPRPLISKKRSAGARERQALLTGSGFQGLGAMIEMGRGFGAKQDDVLDACSAAWTAKRRYDGIARKLPQEPRVDTRGLLMEIWA
jgi:predicted RNase H-like nuclease